MAQLWQFLRGVRFTDQQCSKMDFSNKLSSRKRSLSHFNLSCLTSTLHTLHFNPPFPPTDTTVLKVHISASSPFSFFSTPLPTQLPHISNLRSISHSLLAYWPMRANKIFLSNAKPSIQHQYIFQAVSNAETSFIPAKKSPPLLTTLKP